MTATRSARPSPPTTSAVYSPELGSLPYRDVVVDGRGIKPVDPQETLRPRGEREFRQEDIGYLTKPVRIKEWIAIIRRRYAFLAHLDADEQRWAQCNERDLHAVEAALASFPAHT